MARLSSKKKQARENWRSSMISFYLEGGESHLWRLANEGAMKKGNHGRKGNISSKFQGKVKLNKINQLQALCSGGAERSTAERSDAKGTGGGEKQRECGFSPLSLLRDSVGCELPFYGRICAKRSRGEKQERVYIGIRTHKILAVQKLSSNGPCQGSLCEFWTKKWKTIIRSLLRDSTKLHIIIGDSY
jgi:hypothetical protein